jgi:hypothetical protein
MAIKEKNMKDKPYGCVMLLVLLVLFVAFPPIIPAVIAGGITLAIFRCFSK